MTLRPPDDHDSDEHLLALAAAGDAQAFGALYRRRQGQVFRFALHMTGSAASADDVTQDVFLVVMKIAGRYEPGRSGVPAWLLGIARNCARQRVDRDRLLQPLDGDEHASIGEVAAPHDPLADLTRA